jgi:hypothetical protein
LKIGWQALESGLGCTLGLELSLALVVMPHVAVERANGLINAVINPAFLDQDVDLSCRSCTPNGLSINPERPMGRAK